MRLARGRLAAALLLGAEMPVAQPTTSELILNLKTAKAMGLTVPPSLSGRADQLLQ